MYAPRIIQPKFHWPTIGLTVLACLAGAAGVLIIALHFQQAIPLPAGIKKQVNFPVFLPTAGAAVDTSSYKFDPGQGVLSFTGRLPDGQAVTFAEQAAPSSFTDIPDFYSKFLQTLYDYESFDSLQGTVHLTHPKGAGQAAVMSSKGTLVFVRVARDEQKSTWQPLFNALKVYAP